MLLLATYSYQVIEGLAAGQIYFDHIVKSTVLSFLKSDNYSWYVYNLGIHYITISPKSLYFVDNIQTNESFDIYDLLSFMIIEHIKSDEAFQYVTSLENLT